MRDLLVLLLGKEGRRVIKLKTLGNADLFERWRRELGFRYRTERPRKEAIRFASLFEKFLGGHPPSADLAKQFLSQYLEREQNTRAGYYAQIAMLMKWYAIPSTTAGSAPRRKCQNWWSPGTSTE